MSMGLCAGARLFFFFFTFLSTATYVDWKTVGLFVIIGFAKMGRAGVRFSRKVREPDAFISSLTLRFYPPAPDFSFERSRARALNHGKNASCFAV